MTKRYATVSNRLRLINRLAGGEVFDVLVSPVQSLMQSVPSKKDLEQLRRVIKKGQGRAVR